MPHKTKVLIEKMVEACQTYLQGKSSFQQIAETLGVDRTTIRCWVRRYKTEGTGKEGCLGTIRQIREYEAIEALTKPNGSYNIQDLC